MNYDVLEMKSFAKQLNDLTYTDYFYRLMLIARSVFKWDNLPNGIDEKWIEKYLFSYGCCLFYEDKEKGFMVAKCTPTGTINAYDEYTRLRPYGTNYIGEDLTNFEECVLIQNNDIITPTSATIQLYAYRLAEVTRAIEVNVNAQKTPLIILCSDKQKMSMKNIYKQFTGFEPVIYGDSDGLSLENIKAIKTDAPIVFDKLQQHKHQLWNEVMTFLGVNNANMDKRERLVDDEVQANNEQIEISAQVMLKSRERACKLINEKFNQNISVQLRKDYITQIKQDFKLIEGGVDNVKLSS